MVLTFIEHESDKLNTNSLEALTLGRKLAQLSGAALHAVVINGGDVPTARLGEFGVSTIHSIQDARIGVYAPEAWAAGVAHIVRNESPQIVLAAGSERGNEVMAHLAALLDQPFAANCTAVQPGSPFTVTRLRWGGSLFEEARLDGEPKLLTVAPNTVAAEPAPTAVQPSVQAVTPNLPDKAFRARVTAREAAASGKVSLAEARVVVGGGRGVGSAEGFKELEELADLLGGAVGGSRAVTSLGWRAHSDQIGQTGTRIAPELYIACGVSGAIQHMIGCKGAKHILAINTDPEAPIMSKADYAVIGDLHQVVPAITAALRALRN